jgi:mono/diheme cytochrome c family protein
MSKVELVCVAALSLLTAGCQTGRHSPAGFRLPEGNVKHGKVLFVAMGCSACHEVAGTDLPKPTMQPAIPVVLGGAKDYEVTDGYLVTSIINPNYRLAPYQKEQITIEGHSKMPDFADQMNVAELSDLVAFLQSQYRLREVMPRPYF